MFEGSNQAALGHLAGVNAANARTLDKSIQMYRELGAMYDALKRRCDEAEARVAELELALAVKTAHAGGMGAMKDAFKAAHPNSPVLADSGKRYKSGAVKTKGALVYAAEFDRILRDARISNPERYRAD